MPLAVVMVMLQQAGLLRHLSRAGHARLQPAELRGDILEVLHVPPGEVVQHLGLREHGEELLIFPREAFPALGAVVVTRPSRRRDEVLVVEDLQPFVYLPDAAYVLFLEVAPDHHGGHSASLWSAVSGISLMVLPAGVLHSGAWTRR